MQDFPQIGAWLGMLQHGEWLLAGQGVAQSVYVPLQEGWCAVPGTVSPL